MKYSATWKLNSFLFWNFNTIDNKFTTAVYIVCLPNFKSYLTLLNIPQIKEYVIILCKL